MVCGPNTQAAADRAREQDAAPGFLDWPRIGCCGQPRSKPVHGRGPLSCSHSCSAYKLNKQKKQIFKENLFKALVTGMSDYHCLSLFFLTVLQPSWSAGCFFSTCQAFHPSDLTLSSHAYKIFAPEIHMIHFLTSSLHSVLSELTPFQKFPHNHLKLQLFSQLLSVHLLVCLLFNSLS